jgi:hypothetical protein
VKAERSDKEALISGRSQGRALISHSEKPVSGADLESEPEPEIVVEAVQKLTSVELRQRISSLPGLCCANLLALCSELFTTIIGIQSSCQF